MPEEGHRELCKLGEVIRTRRKAIGVSQEDFAELMGVHRTFVGHIERAEANISFVNILRAARALKVQPSTLFKDAGL